MKARVAVIIVTMWIRSVAIVEDGKNEIKQYLLGQLTEADEERVELRLMSDRAFSEEFDIVVDEIATRYVKGHFTGDEKTQVEQYFLRSPERREKVQFICELLRQVDGEVDPKVDDEKNELTGQNFLVQPAVPTGDQINLWQRVRSLWTDHPATFRPAISFAALLMAGGLVFFVALLNSKPNYLSFVLAMTNTERNVGAEPQRIHLDSGIDGLRLKLSLPTPRAPQYRASLRGGEGVSIPQLTVESQDAESMTVIVPANEVPSGTYVIELKEVSGEIEKPIRGSYVFTVD
jgi:hypothetical protein